MCDSIGDWPLASLTKFLVKVARVVVKITDTNHKINANNKKQIDNEIETSYTQEAAKEEIDEILGKYGDDVTVSFNDDGVEITNSIKVRSRYDRQKISAIITRTDTLTSREYDDISAEWLFHNIAYDLHIKRDSAISANLDYTSDSRWYVSVATDLFEFFGWE